MRLLSGVLLSAFILVLTVAAPARAADGPIVVDGKLVYPDGADIPRYMTDIEKQWVAEHGWPARPRVATAQPSGPLHCVAEYEQMEGILIAWEGTTAQKTILAQMGREITTTANTRLYVSCDNAATQTSATSSLTSAGANMSKVIFSLRTTDTIWLRDYGPRYCYEGDVRVVVDHTYNRPRPNDDVVPQSFAASKKNPYYEFQNLYGNFQLIHGGGNYHLDAAGRGYASRLTVNENPTLTEPQIVDVWGRYWGVQHTFFNPLPSSIDSTQHIDMWMQALGDNRMMISDWPLASGSAQDVICDGAAATLAAAGYTVFRCPALSVGGTHYTYTNVAICNNLLLLPTYTNATVVPYNAQALAAWQAATAGTGITNIAQIDCQGIVTSAGVMHCIVMHIPVPRGGANPTVYLKNLRGGDVLTPGNQVSIKWISDDDVGTVNADLRLSTDGGMTYPTIIVAATADDGEFTWTVPNICTAKARIRVVARDGSGNTGYDSSAANFRIAAVPCPGDMNCDGFIDTADVEPMVLAMVDPLGYAAAYPSCNINNGDLTGDTLENGDDLQLFVAAILAP